MTEMGNEGPPEDRPPTPESTPPGFAAPSPTPPPMPPQQPPQAPQPMQVPQQQPMPGQGAWPGQPYAAPRVRKFSGAAIALGIFTQFVGVLFIALIAGALAYGGGLAGAPTALDYLWSGLGAGLIALHVGLVLGIVLVVTGSPSRRGWGMGLLIGYPIALMSAPVLGLLACFGALG